jgi:hypothetical protein
LTPIRAARKVEMIDGLVEWAGEVVMSASNGASSTKGTTSLEVAFKGDPDIAVLKRQLKKVPLTQSRSGELLDVRIIDKMMAKSRRRLVGVYLISLGIALLAVIPWAWSFASRAVAAQQAVSASFLGQQFNATPEFSMVLIVLLTATLGSVSVLAMTFSARTGRETLERGFFWWYLTRPISAAGLGLVFYLAFVSGFLAATTSTGQPTLIVAATIGGLAGLFTDQVYKKLFSVLGLVDSGKRASGTNTAGADVADSAG